MKERQSNEKTRYLYVKRLGVRAVKELSFFSYVTAFARTLSCSVTPERNSRDDLLQQKKI